MCVRACEDVGGAPPFAAKALLSRYLKLYRI